ncbi:dipeptide epimerase [Oceanithermus desulfurans]|uniref:Dipeptide epimerase n=2 Tax=Oceanithermus desulfurans TaxID=227924 RepID=A0A511RHM5_9DEIN|nr:dipeptide epimerase [Oceanithermus desulfurans]MBB6029208.1 L-alanine-DL-glutamate epimerase-like enolase superfamily enzyme [Oceanithermus desulfurans]GEM89154.1 dipeptide epimerase [Oceanithermus desulfurans NBRC 100063]
MRLDWQTYTLEPAHPFRIAHGTSLTRTAVFVDLEGGLGEAAVVPYHGESVEAVTAYLEAARERLADAPDTLQGRLERLPAEGSRAARAAVEMALFDLWGRALGAPLWRLFGLDPDRAPPTSFTVAMGAPEEMAGLARASGMPVLKLKVGSEDDLARLEAVRAARPDARIRVDANGGWTPETARRLLPELVRLGVEFLEQPLPPEDRAAYAELRGRGLPLFADEPIKTVRDVVDWAPYVDGVVVKLAKSGGIAPARAQIETARALGLEVMLGCMVETRLAVGAAAHLAPLADHADLDGPLLIKNDPFTGLDYHGARLRLPAGPGLGIRPRT